VHTTTRLISSTACVQTTLDGSVPAAMAATLRDLHCIAGTPRPQVLAFVDAYLLQSESNELAVWGVGAGTR
jgi:hypothetical protein